MKAYTFNVYKMIIISPNSLGIFSQYNIANEFPYSIMLMKQFSKLIYCNHSYFLNLINNG